MKLGVNEGSKMSHMFFWENIVLLFLPSAHNVPEMCFILIIVQIFKKVDRKLKCCNAQNEVTSRNVCCQNANRKAACDDYMLDILHKIEQRACETLPMPNAGDSPHISISRWNEDIEPYKKDALFWHSVWLSAGRPLHTQVMKRTRAVYRLQIQKNRRMLDTIKNTLLDACLNNQNVIFTEIKIIRKNAQSFANTIDSNRDNIPHTSLTNMKNYVCQ